MIKSQFLTALIFGKNPESLILLDLITTDNTVFPNVLTGSADVENLVFSPFYKFLPSFSGLSHSCIARAFDAVDLSHYDGLLSSLLTRSKLA